MEKINLKQILAKHSGAYKDALDNGREEKVAISGFDAISAMQEACNLTVDKCKKNAHLSDFALEFLQEGADGAIVMEDIEQVKKMIL